MHPFIHLCLCHVHRIAVVEPASVKVVGVVGRYDIISGVLSGVRSETVVTHTLKLPSSTTNHSHALHS